MTDKRQIRLSNGKLLSLEYGPLIMGILNVTPDSFSDGGKFYDTNSAVHHAGKMAKEGADIIDIGGESTRPGSSPVSEEEELRRVLPVIEELAGRKNIIISVDTYKSVVAAEALKHGAHMVNDISAGTFDPAMKKVVKDFGCPAVLMHIKGTPKNMQVNPQYNAVNVEIKDYLKKRTDEFIEYGISRDKLIIDPGFGFGKTAHDNMKILSGLDGYKELGFPLLVGVSRKSFIGHYTGIKDPGLRLAPTLSALTVAILNGADIVRVHDVRETREVVSFLNGYNSGTAT